MTSAGSALNRQATKTDPTESTAERVIGYSVVRGKVAKGCRIHLRTPFLFPSCGGSCAADNWRGVRIPGSSSVGQRLAQVAFLASRERPSRGVPPTTRRVAVSVGVLS
ncbi:hypothetical protein DTO027B5_7727 [Paecilomyces variotii]|nr:hypothetical protein DTO169C6_5024 [Paecilomyces variotii]KAJ9284480.1 hypothetical protein DTO021C3_7917 [Paecilomyces variotii]KAJ9323426.1 hypothetical protein DTO027B3_5544 [Paecilomyces variotii]KAJ9330527.1 hypothetical protein DTO027B5_7727 [Paecilomyces variotii]KAJ9398177.1 hypothetical protein DTO282F9_4862 [Paecilomyces variotii]